MKNSYDIIIVGAGMVGASAALSLARQGFSIALIEQQQKALTFDNNADIDLRVSAISIGSEKFLAQLGVWPLIQTQRLCAYHKMTVWDENSSGQLHFDAANQAQSHLGHIVENNLTIAALQQQLSACSNVTILWNKSIKDIQNGAEKVSVNLKGNITLESQLLIAADGKNSFIRQQLNIDLVSQSYQQSAIVANVSTQNPHQNTAWQRFLSTGPLAFLPLNNAQSSIVWSCSNELADSLMAMNDADFCQQLGISFEHNLGEIHATSKRAKFELNWQYAENFVQNRCVLIGDAAHGIHPLAGQGVNLGFADAQLLGELLNPDLLNNPSKVLRKFERQRKHDGLITLHGMSAINAIFASKSAFIQSVRASGMLLIDNQLMLKRAIIQSANNA